MKKTALWRALPLLLATVAMHPFAAAEMPALVSGHPRVLATKSDFESLKLQLEPTKRDIPASGSIRFTLKPSFQAASDNLLAQAEIFGNADNVAKGNRLYIKYTDADTADQATLTVRMVDKNNVNIVVQSFTLPMGTPSTVKFEWNSTASQPTATLTVNNTQLPPLWWRPDQNNVRFKPTDTQFRFMGRSNDELSDFEMRDATGVLVAIPRIDNRLLVAYHRFLNEPGVAKRAISELGNCNAAPGKEYCNVSTAHRNTLTANAQNIALAYKLSGDGAYLDAAKKYIDRIVGAPITANGDMSMMGRIGALAILYDWLYDELDTGYRAKMVRTIKQTIQAEAEPGGSNLASEICGNHNPILDGASFTCRYPVDYETRGTASIADAYIAGMNFSAVSEIAAALIAIADGDERAKVLPLLEIAYKHYEQGFLKAREYISADGGSHSGFAYALSDVPKRVKLWRTALQHDGATIFPAEWLGKTAYPYIYGLRSDDKFPGSGDRFKLHLYDKILTDVFAAAIDSPSPDLYADAFYRQQILPSRGIFDYFMLLERLLWPGTAPGRPTPTELTALPLSRRFNIAGQVLMRDNWDYKAGTLVEFKSTSFSSLNHQHMDQNSFTLAYKGPLLLDSGVYDEYSSPHWGNYFIRSIAHNTVVVPMDGEQYVTYQNKVSNDGGQWVPYWAKPPAALAPTIEELKTSNTLGGIKRYEYGADYTVVTGDAAKAYHADKLAGDGFDRTLVFLHAPSSASKPVLVVFDKVKTLNPLKSANPLPAYFVLHTSAEPQAAVDANEGSQGRYPIPFADKAPRQIWVRNGKGSGAATIETLLPANARITKVGGINREHYCEQRGSVTTNLQDCRFTVLEKDANGMLVSVNYAPKTDNEADTGADVGAWRLEIAAQAVPADGRQIFLNVIAVADDEASAPVPPKAESLLTDQNTAAVKLGTDTVLAFNRLDEPAAGLGYVVSGATKRLIAVGLRPNEKYYLSTSAHSSGGNYVKLTQRVDGTAYTSSAEGIVNIEL
jgi:hypothetical protein